MQEDEKDWETELVLSNRLLTVHRINKFPYSFHFLQEKLFRA